jgi:pSer/pThr/pTyr-binding forkhead associated (FHA) protein
MLKLQLRDHPDRYVMLTSGLITLGRDDANDLVLTTGPVSDFHAEVVVEDDAVVIVDLLSRSGTFVNGQRIGTRQLLSPWDVIRIGFTELELNDPNVDRPSPWMLAVRSPDGGVENWRVQPTTVIGRDSSCDVCLDSDLLSRRHVELRIAGYHLEVEDLGSVNGTFLNGRPVTSALAYPHDELTIEPYRIALIGPPSNSGDTDRTQVKSPDRHAGSPAGGDETEFLDDRKESARLICRWGEAEQTFQLNQEPVTLGRSLDNDVVINDRSVSNLHARIFREPRGWLVQDLDSRNGLIVNGELVDQAQLSHGDEIELGRATARFELVLRRNSSDGTA